MCVSDFTVSRHIHMPHVIKMHYKSSMKQNQQVLFRNIIVETSFSREMFKNFISCLRNVKESALLEMYTSVRMCTCVHKW